MFGLNLEVRKFNHYIHSHISQRNSGNFWQANWGQGTVDLYTNHLKEEK